MGIGPVDWYGEKRRIEASKAMGEFTYGGLRHGRTCLQLSDIRGYENLMFDMADWEPLLMEPAKNAGKIVHMHLDGNIRLQVDDIRALFRNANRKCEGAYGCHGKIRRTFPVKGKRRHSLSKNV